MSLFSPRSHLTRKVKQVHTKRDLKAEKKILQKKSPKKKKASKPKSSVWDLIMPHNSPKALAAA